MELSKKDIEQMKKWVKALKSGRFAQTQSALQDSKGFCCLGVACKVLVPKKKLIYQKVSSGKSYIGGGMPNSQHEAPQWLKDINDDFKKYRPESLIGMNDASEKKQWSFKDIADAIEATYLVAEPTEARLNRLVAIELKRK